MPFTSSFRRPRLALAAGAGLALLAGCSHPEPLRPGDLLLPSERPGDGAPVRVGAPVVSWVAPSWRPLPPRRVADTLARRMGMAPPGSSPKARRALAREIESVLFRARNEFTEANRPAVPILERVVPNTFVVVLEEGLSAAVRRRLLYESDPMVLRTGNAAFDSFNERNGLSKVSVLEDTKFLFHFDHPVDFIPPIVDLPPEPVFWIYIYRSLHFPYVDREKPLGPYMEGVEGVDTARYDDHAHGVHEGMAGYEDAHGSYFGDSDDVTLTKSNGTWCLEVQRFLDWGLYLSRRFVVEGDEAKEIFHGRDAGKCAAVFGWGIERPAPPDDSFPILP